MHPCYRCIDKPQLLYGLEAEDVAVIVLGVGMGSLLFEPYIPGIVGILAWMTLVKFKQGKPPGHLLHTLYGWGIDLPGLVPSPFRVKQYGAYVSSSI